eukprot:1036817-Rhodomonas_salina.1
MYYPTKTVIGVNRPNREAICLHFEDNSYACWGDGTDTWGTGTTVTTTSFPTISFAGPAPVRFLVNSLAVTTQTAVVYENDELYLFSSLSSQTSKAATFPPNPNNPIVDVLFHENDGVVVIRADGSVATSGTDYMAVLVNMPSGPIDFAPQCGISSGMPNCACTECTICASDQYVSTECGLDTDAACAACPSQHVCNGTHATACLVCEPGTYQGLD